MKLSIEWTRKCYTYAVQNIAVQLAGCGQHNVAYMLCVQMLSRAYLEHKEALHQRRQGWLGALGVFLGPMTGPWGRQDCLKGRQVASQLTNRHNVSSNAIQPCNTRAC